MTDETPDQPKIAPIQSGEKSQKTTLASDKAKTSPIPIIIALLALCLGAGSLWQTWEIKKQSTLFSSSLTEQLSGIQSQVGEIETRSTSFQGQLDSLNQESTQQLERLNQEFQASAQELQEQFLALQKQQHRRVRLGYTQSAENAIIEAMAIAYRKLHYEKDAPGTIALIELVIDTYCHPPAKAALLPVCLGLETDRTKLTHLEIPNVNRALQELTSIQEHLINSQKDLGLKQAQRQQPDEKKEARAFSSFNSASELLAYSFNQMGAFIQKYFVKVHRVNENKPSQLTVDQKTFLTQNVVLLLQQAKAACLRKDQALFELSLSEAKRAYSLYLGGANDALNHLQTIQSLSTIKLQPNLPRLSATYAALSQLTNTPDNDTGSQ